MPQSSHGRTSPPRAALLLTLALGGGVLLQAHADLTFNATDELGSSSAAAFGPQTDILSVILRIIGEHGGVISL